jgi:putative DNA methylase
MMAPSWVISKNRKVVAKLVPDHEHRRFDIEIHSGASKAEMAAAEQGTVRDGSLLVPDVLAAETWAAIAGIQPFYLRMLDMEATGAAKLDNDQNFAKAFRVQDYAAVMASVKPNAARLKGVTEFQARDLTDRTEIGPTRLGARIVTIQEFLADKDPEVVMANLRDAVPDYLGQRPRRIDMAGFLAAKARQPEIRRAAEAIAGRMRNQRLQ